MSLDAAEREELRSLREAQVLHEVQCAEYRGEVAVKLDRLRTCLIVLVVINGAEFAGGIELVKALLA